MKVDNVPGEFAFPALTKTKESHNWGITTHVFFSREEVEKYYDPQEWDIKFPVEVMDNGAIYCPAEEELK